MTDIRRMSHQELDELNTHAMLWPRCKSPQPAVADDTSGEPVAETTEKGQITQLDLGL